MMTKSARSRRGLLKLGLLGGAALGLAPRGAAVATSEAPMQVRPSIDARSLGAVGNGKVNDAPAIQRAIDQAAALGGGRVHIPEGEYKLSQGLVVRTPNTVLTGNGRGTVLRLETSATFGIQISAPSAIIADLTLLGAGRGVLLSSACDGTPGSSYSRPFRSAPSVLLSSTCPGTPGPGPNGFQTWENVYCSYGAVGFDISTPAMVRGCRLEYFSTAAIRVNNTLDVFIHQVSADEGAGSYWRQGDGIQILNADAVSVTDSDFLRFNRGIYFAAGTGYRYNKHNITSTNFDTCNYGAYIADNGGENDGIIFKGCWLGSNAGTGLESYRARGLRISDSTIANNGAHGIGLYGITDFAVIQGCVITGNSSSSSGVYSGIKVAGFAVGALINANRIGRTMGYNNTQAYAISIDVGNRVYIVTDNNIADNVNWPAWDDHSSGTQRIYADNVY